MFLLMNRVTSTRKYRRRYSFSRGGDGLPSHDIGGDWEWHGILARDVDLKSESRTRPWASVASLKRRETGQIRKDLTPFRGRLIGSNDRCWLNPSSAGVPDPGGSKWVRSPTTTAFRANLVFPRRAVLNGAGSGTWQPSGAPVRAGGAAKFLTTATLSEAGLLMYWPNWFET